MEQTELQTEHLLLDLEDNYVRASGGKRFANYLIDVALFYLVLVGIGVLWAILSPDTVNLITENNISGFTDRVLTLALYALFMFAQEGLLKGRSLGKFITGTRAVNLDGSTITAGKAMVRGLSRAVPFCAFSALGTPCFPWHDKWTDTMVIDVKKSTDITL